MSKGEPIFKDRKSAIITIAVVAALILFAIVAIDRTSVNRFTKLQRIAQEYQAEVLAAIEERFGYAETIAKILAEEQINEGLSTLLADDYTALSTQKISALYIAIDTELAALQRTLYELPVYKRLAPYFEEIYRCELELIAPLAGYHEYAEYFNIDIKAFPAILTARRLDLTEFDFFDFGASLKSRP